MGNPEFADFDALVGTEPPPQYDSLIHEYLGLSGSPTSSIPPSSWSNRAVFDYNATYSAIPTAICMAVEVSSWLQSGVALLQPVHIPIYSLENKRRLSNQYTSILQSGSVALLQ